MSFITDGKTLCRDMWPGNAGRISPDADKAETLPKWRLLPSTYERLCERVVVEGLSTPRPRVLCVHPDLGKRTELCIRLVGIVGQASLSVRGDWKGEESEAMKAMQYLTLVNFGCRPAFSHQRNALVNLEELVLSMMNQQGGRNVVAKGAIQLKRRAFTKAEHGAKPVKILDTDDSAAEIKAMSKRWVVDHRITTAVLQQPGSMALVNPYAIRRGDLVDVAVTVEVVTTRGRRGRKSEVMLCPRQVIRLKTAAEIKRVLGQGSSDASASIDAGDVVMGTEEVLGGGDIGEDVVNGQGGDGDVSASV